MRRALSKRRHRTMSEAVYEEIQHRHNHFTQRGSHILCVDAEEMVKEITPGYYNDVITDGLKPDRETGVTLLLYNSI
ncbi:hypothetical protein cypCar_00038357 [Cyprinus carpio]|nr:hypothetical protein cypCar_00038357 [Cyprinus carpio]